MKDFEIVSSKLQNKNEEEHCVKPFNLQIVHSENPYQAQDAAHNQIAIIDNSIGCGQLESNNYQKISIIMYHVT